MELQFQSPAQTPADLHYKDDLLSIKGGVSDFWQPMLTFEITKTNTPLPQKGLTPILIALPHTYVRQRLVLWNKTKLIITNPRHDKSPTVNCCLVLFMTYWHKFLMIFNGHFIASSVDRLGQDNCRVRCRHGVSLLLFRRRFPRFVFYPPSLSFCRRSAQLMSIMCTDERSLLCIVSIHAPYCWLATSLFWYSAWLVF